MYGIIHNSAPYSISALIDANLTLNTFFASIKVIEKDKESLPGRTLNLNLTKIYNEGTRPRTVEEHLHRKWPPLFYSGRALSWKIYHR